MSPYDRRVNTRNSEWPWWAETALVFAVTAASVQNAYVTAGGRLADPSVVVAVVAGGILLLRRRWPLPVAAVAVTGAGGWGLILPLLVALFHLAVSGRVKESAAAVVLALAVNALVHPAVSLWTTRAYGAAVPLLLAVVLGMWANSRRRLADTLAAQVDRLHREQDLRESAARAVERTAIAAEMHDVLAHRLSLIALHTGALAIRRDQLSAGVADRIDLLRRASTDALADLRDVLGALRDPDTEANRSLAPPLRGLDELITAARNAGHHVDTDILGRADQAPAAHRLAVYRLVQESLTNARKHAPEAAISIRVNYGPPSTTVEVANSASGAHSSPDTVLSGLGLVGLRERVQALGGRLEAGPAGGDGWRVAASIPDHTSEHPDEQNSGPS